MHNLFHGHLMIKHRKNEIFKQINNLTYNII